MSTPLLDLIKSRLPFAGNKAQIAKAAIQAANYFNPDPLKPEAVIRTVASLKQWYSFDKGSAFRANRVAAKTEETFDFVKSHKTGQLIGRTGISGRTAPVVRDNGAYFYRNDSFNFDSSDFVNQSFSLVILFRPYSIQEGYLFDSYFLGGTSSADLNYLQLGYCPSAGTGNPVVDSGSTAFGSGVIYDNGNLSVPVRLKMSASVQLEANSHIPANSIAYRFLTVRSNSEGVRLYENEVKLAEFLTQSFLTGFPGARIGDSGNGNFPLSAVSLRDFLVFPNLTETELKVVRVFLSFYKNLRIYKQNEDAFDGFRYKAFGFGNKIASNRNWDDYSHSELADTEVHPTGVDALAVASDGTVFASNYYEETGKRLCVFKDGKVIGFKNHAEYGGEGVAINSTHLFYTFINKDTNTVYYRLQRTKRTLENGVFTLNQFDPEPLKFTTDTIINTSPFEGVSSSTGAIDFTKAPKGLAATDTEVFVSDPQGNKIKVYDASTGAALRTWTATSLPGRMALDPGGSSLWVCQSDRVVKYDLNGTVLLSTTIVPNPVAICFNSAGTLIVASKSQSITKIDVSGAPTQAGTFGNGDILASARGVNCGMYALGYFRNITDMRCDGSDNIYIAETIPGASSLTVMKLSDGSLVWESYSSLFTEACSFDPDDENILYSAYFKFRINHIKGAWNRVATHFNGVKYPNDARAQGYGERTQIVKLVGKRFLTVLSNNEQVLSFYRYDSAVDGEVSIPCAKIDLLNDRVWFDYNGNAVVDSGEQFNFAPPNHLVFTCVGVDGFGNILALNPEARLPSFDLYVLKYNFLGLNQFGCPLWDMSNPIKIPIPQSENYQSVTRFVFNKEGTILGIGAYSNGVSRSGFSFGDVVSLFNYDRNGNALTTVSSFKVFNFTSDNRQTKDLRILKDKVLVGYLQNYFGFDNTFPVFRFYDFNGSELAKLGYLPQEVNFSWLDVNHPFDAVQNSLGQILISSEDIAYGRNQLTIAEFSQAMSFPSFDPASKGFSNWWSTRKSSIGVVSGVLSLSDSIGTRTLSAPNAQASPTINSNAIQGFKSLVFDGVNSYLQTASYTLNQPVTLFLVLKTLAGISPGAAILDGVSATSILLDLFPDATSLRMFAQGASVTQSGILATNNWMILSCVFAGASSRTRINGVSVVNGDPGNAAPGGLTIGARGNGLSPSKIEVVDVLLAPSIVSNDNQNYIGRYLSKIFNLPWTAIAS